MRAQHIKEGIKTEKGNTNTKQQIFLPHLSTTCDNCRSTYRMKCWHLIICLHNRRLSTDCCHWSNLRCCRSDDLRRRRSNRRLAYPWRCRRHHTNLSLTNVARHRLTDWTYLRLKEEWRFSYDDDDNNQKLTHWNLCCYCCTRQCNDGRIWRINSLDHRLLRNQRLSKERKAFLQSYESSYENLL